MSIQGLLEQVRVVDLSQYIPGPFAARQLADLGADVIKIEPPQGDPMRFFLHDASESISPIYRHINRGKRIGKLDLKTSAGREVLAELLVDADILIESYRPGVLARLGFDRNRLDQINAQLIHCALSGYGQQGPYATRAGHDINYCAVSSQALVSGTEQRPIVSFPPIADHSAALQASNSILAALYARSHRNRGIYLDISMTESILAWQYLPMLGRSSERAASILNGGAACYNFYRCADGRFASLGAIEPVFWRNFCKAMNQHQWIDRQFETMPQQALMSEVAEHIETQPGTHWQALLQNLDCCFELLLAPTELSEHPQLVARQALNHDTPNHAAWINRQPIQISNEIDEIDASAKLTWKARHYV